MSLLNAVKPILNSKTAKVVLEVSANPNSDDELVVVAKPVVGPVSNKATDELHKLCAALATPLKAIGTPETIEAELYAVVNEQAAHRQGWASRAAELDALIAQAAQKDIKTKPAPQTKTKASTDTKQDEDLPIAGQSSGQAASNEPAKSDTDNLALEL
ncbi:hypothetical protein [Marinobacter subterrani]|uniref:hypothetical protein n=1 Tax=Marinobacter subterrani TaxID=1658765 RepID=UPI0023553183|nr:hypothetical protein [Marinobacter subterrani]